MSMDPQLWKVQLDARVWYALDTVPAAAPLDAVAERAGVGMDDLIDSMTRLSLRTKPLLIPYGTC